MSKSAFCISDLQKGAKRLQSIEAKMDSDSKSSSDFNEVELQSLEQLYADHNGDLDKIFEELKCSPSKAKKPHHCPKDGKEFSRKYLEGYYSIIDENLSEGKNYK